MNINVYYTLTSFVMIYNIQFHMSTINGTLSPSDGSVRAMLFTECCSKGSKFSAPDTTLAVVKKGLNMWQKMHMGSVPEDWNKMAHVLLPGTVFY
jgi:hypothetical protein